MDSTGAKLTSVQAATGPISTPNAAPQAIKPSQSRTQISPGIEDTVTLTGQSSVSQPALPQSNPPPPQSQLANGVAPVTLAQAPDSSQRSDPPPQSQTPNQPPLVQLTASALPAAATATGSSNNAASSASQQQLANLEAMLQQLGIDPQSLSGPALSALVHDAASPAALLAYVKELQGTSPPAAPSADHINVTA